MEMMEYINGEALILIPFLWIIGVFLKKTPKVRDWQIPWLLLGVSIISANALLGISVQSVVQGTLVTGGAVLGHQLFKQTTKRG